MVTVDRENPLDQKLSALHRLFLVLLDNSLKYSHEGTEVVLTIDSNDSDIAVAIEDFRRVVESLKAAIMPQESEYYYYLHGSDGQIYYGKTNDEHNENKRKYL